MPGWTRPTWAGARRSAGELRRGRLPGPDVRRTVRQVRLQPTVVQNVVSYTTVIDVPNPNGLLKPGMTATLDIEVARADDVLRVPAAALRFRPTDAVLAALGSVPAPDTSARRACASRSPDDGMEARQRAPDPSRRAEGLSDNVSVAIESDEIQEGDQVVTGMSVAAAAAAPAADRIAAHAVVPTPARQFRRRRPSRALTRHDHGQHRPHRVRGHRPQPAALGPHRARHHHRCGRRDRDDGHRRRRAGRHPVAGLEPRHQPAHGRARARPTSAACASDRAA